MTSQNRLNKITIGLLTIALMSFVNFITVNAETLTSPTYRILDPTISSGGGVSTSPSYSLLSSVNPTADRRLTSTSYAIKSGFPNGIYANVPLILCAEGNTDAGNSNCLNFPNNAGAQGECGTPGCTNRIKVEIDPQNNPIDTLYLVGIFDNTTNTQYYLQSDHTLDITYDISDYMTICDIEGKDTRSGSGCEVLTDPNWDEDLQSANVFGLTSNRSYTVQVRALHGDFTESEWSPTETATTEALTLSFDLDIAGSGGFATETASPYAINLGVLTPEVVITSTDRIWFDINTNNAGGLSLHMKDLHNGLYSTSFTIPSISEDLAVDTDENGGFGAKITSATQASLGPIQSDPTYNTTNPDEVGLLSTTPELLFFTNNTGINQGQVSNGRASIVLKALAKITTPSGAYSDTITFYLTPNV